MLEEEERVCEFGCLGLGPWPQTFCSLQVSFTLIVRLPACSATMLLMVVAPDFPSGGPQWSLATTKSGTVQTQRDRRARPKVTYGGMNRHCKKGLWDPLYATYYVGSSRNVRQRQTPHPTPKYQYSVAVYTVVCGRTLFLREICQHPSFFPSVKPLCFRRSIPWPYFILTSLSSLLW